MALRRNDFGNIIGKMQRGLIAWNSAALPVYGADKDFGAESETWVKNYQDASDLVDTADFKANPALYGVCDGVTFGALMEILAVAEAEGHAPHPPEPHDHDKYAAKVHPHAINDPTIT